MTVNRRVIYRKAGGSRVVDLIEEGVPEPAAHEVLVRVEASGLAFADIVQRNGLFPGQPAFPMTPGYDICGRIEAVGREAGRRLRKGQRVAGVITHGGHADYICVDPSLLVPVPEDLDAAQVVALCLNYVTASQMLHRLASIEPGETMLVHAAGGGVGTALLELGALYEMTMYGTVSRSKARVVEELGGIPIDYAHQDFVEDVVRATDGYGVMSAFDAIGARHAARTMKCLSNHGRMVMYGVTSGFAGGKARKWTLMKEKMVSSAPFMSLYAKGQSVLSYDIEGLRAARPSWYREDLTLLIDLLDTGRLKPVIAARYPLESAGEAQEEFVGTKAAGKFVLVCHEETHGARPHSLRAA